MLCKVVHRWNQGSRFVFNPNRHWVCCLVWTKPGMPALVIHSKEGIRQDDCLPMSLYGVVLVSLPSKMWEVVTKTHQLWYWEKAGTAEKALPNSPCLNFFVKFGP